MYFARKDRMHLCVRARTPARSKSLKNTTNKSHIVKQTSMLMLIYIPRYASYWFYAIANFIFADFFSSASHLFVPIAYSFSCIISRFSYTFCVLFLDCLKFHTFVLMGCALQCKVRVHMSQPKKSLNEEKNSK